MSRIDEKLKSAIGDIVECYQLEMMERFDTDGDPCLIDRDVWHAQVAAACEELELVLRTDLDAAMGRVDSYLDDGEFMSSNQVLEVLKNRKERNARKVRVTERLEEELHGERSQPGIIPLSELCKVPS